MTNTINWNNIRAIEGQREDFEELVCQLAGAETIPNQKKFIRVGKPDGGKECMWELNDGSLHAWQAKYFTSSLDSGQWNQVDDSVKTAIDGHPNLVCFYVAIPVDRPDSKAKGKSMLTKWNEKVTEWEAYALNKGMTVSFEYWGKHELEKRLIKKEHEGRRYYWFNQEEITDEWLEKKNEDNIHALGGRYTPDLNFELPIAKLFSGLKRDEELHEITNELYDDLMDKSRRIYSFANNKLIEDEKQKMLDTVSVFKNSFDLIDWTGISVVPLNSLHEKINAVNVAIETFQNLLFRLRGEEEKSKKEQGHEIDYYIRPYNNEIAELRDFETALRKFENHIYSVTCELVNRPYLIIVGPAGIGKSHLLADIVSSRKQQGYGSLLLLGENFSTAEMPWTQILNNQLRTVKDESTFLGALNAKAEAQQKRFVIFIDALNEGNGRSIWPKRVKSFIKSFEPYPWLGLVLSVRDSFEKLIAPLAHVDETIASRTQHRGFEGVEYQASSHFFKHYDIIEPSSPLLQPEFQNPLFLKLFCDGLKKKGLKNVPPGYEGITVIIGNYLEGVEARISEPDQLDYDVKLKLLQSSVQKILEQLAEDGLDHIPYQTAELIVRKEFEGKTNSSDHQYLKRLISEGVLNEDLYWDDDGNHYDGIHFTYQRFQDHLTTALLLDKHLNTSDPQKSFSQGVLKELFIDEATADYNQNIIEALAIQIPERIGLELADVIPHASKFYAVADSFIKSLLWRKPNTVTDHSHAYAKEVIFKNRNLYYKFLSIVLGTALKPGFYYNAELLHKGLFKLSLAKRDAEWTIWLQDKYGEDSYPNPIRRIIDWAWNENEKTHIDNETVKLAGIILGWCFTSSNRHLRDAATKGAVCLFQDRIPVLLETLKNFENVNDPYVLERLFAVAYGSAVRTRDTQSLIPLCEYIYNTIFDTKKVYPHILLRDYARNIIEYSVQQKLSLTLDLKKSRPPYKSELPAKLPTVEEIDKHYEPKGETGNYNGKKWGSTAILSSMTTEYGRGTSGYGDFGRYTFESALRNWEVDCDGLSNYAVQKIFELGYDPELFTEFDSQQQNGRSRSHKERIGKKYQWIVFYELLARVSDNCKLKDDSAWLKKNAYSKYDGSWHPYVRDIDPTMVIKETYRKSSINELKTKPWWCGGQYIAWQSDHEEWMKKDDFPQVLDFLTVKDNEGIEWINLWSRFGWDQPKKVGEDENKSLRGQIRYDIGSVLIKPTDLKKILKVDNTNNAWRKWSPELSNRYQVFSREFYWSPAWRFFSINRYYGGDEIPVKLEDTETEKKLATVLKTTQFFLWEEEYDCSKEEPITFLKPSLTISSGLHFGRTEGSFVNDAGELICFDPSILQKGPSALLIRKDHLLNLLSEMGYCLLWIINGEKRVLGGFNNKTAPNFNHQLDSLFYLDKSGKIEGQTKTYIRKY